MLPALKKKREGGAPAALAWHPNFRNADRLPDLKVVRTTFFVNGAAIFVAVILLLLLVFQEYKILTLRGDIQDWETKIEEDRRGSAAAVTKFRSFQAIEKRIKEAENLAKPRMVVSEFLLNLGADLPENIAISSVEFRATGVALTGIVRGAPELASGYASQYVEQLTADAKIGPLFASVSMTGLNRDPNTGQITIAIALNFPEPK